MRNETIDKIGLIFLYARRHILDEIKQFFKIFNLSGINFDMYRGSALVDFIKQSGADVACSVFEKLNGDNNISMCAFARSFKGVDIIRAKKKHIPRLNQLLFTILNMCYFTFRYVKNFVERMAVGESVLIMC